MQFGAFVPQGWRLDLVDIATEDHWPTILRVASSMEAARYDSVWVYDHFHTVPLPTQEATYEAWTLMAALAATTKTVRLGQMCTCNAYRPPAYLAKVAASIDVISGGRLEMGIGSGWYDHEFAGYGYEFPAPSVRIRMLGEALEIMRRMWTEDVVSFDGEYYQLDGAISRPKPLQKPHIPLWVAGEGEQLTLRLVARYADYANFGWELDSFQYKSQVLARHCDEVGRDFNEITRSSNFGLVCAESEDEVTDRIDQVEQRYARFAGPEVAAQRTVEYRAASGTPDQVIEHLRPFVDAGLGYAIVYFPDAAYDTSSFELFAAEVMPAFR